MSQRHVRRAALVALLIGLGSLFAALLPASFSDASGFTKGREVAPFPTEFVPGDYIWHPEISAAGPVVILVSLPDQVLYVFRNGVRIGRSTVLPDATVRAARQRETTAPVPGDVTRRSPHPATPEPRPGA